MTQRASCTINVESSGTYYFWVKAADSYYSTTTAASGFSDVYEFEYNPLYVPQNINAVLSEKTKNTVTVSWDTTGANYYWVYYSTTDSKTSLESPVTAYSSSCDITLKSSGTYYFWVKSADSYYSSYSSANTSDFSEFASCDFIYEKLDTPTNIKVEVSEKTKNTVTVSWDSTGAAYYWLYYSTTNDKSKLTSPNVGYISTVSTSVTLTESGTYYFWVKSADSYYSSSSSANTSDFSESASCDFIYEKLDTPTNIKVEVSKETKNTVTVSWDTTGANYYWLYYSTTNDKSKLTSPNVGYIRTVSTSVTLTKSGTYYFWVKSANGFFTSDFSSTASDFSESASYKFTYTN